MMIKYCYLCLEIVLRREKGGKGRSKHFNIGDLVKLKEDTL